jgi:hypothetical protein
MRILPYLLVIGAWMLPVLRLWASRGKAQARDHRWLVATCVCFALFFTCLQNGTTDLLARAFGRGTVYATCSLVALVMFFAVLRYQRIYQHTILAPQPYHIPGLRQLHRGLVGAWLSAGVTIFGIEAVWFRTWIDARGLLPVALVVEQAPLVVSRVVLHGYVLSALWLGVCYPYLYLLWHQQRLDPAFREQGGHWRLVCFVGTIFVISVDLIVHTSATVLIYLQPHWTATLYSTAHTLSAIGGPVLVVGLLLCCLPQRIFWGICSYRLYHRLVPLHQEMRKIVTNIYLDVPRPRLWQILHTPLQSIIALNRVRAEITDARFICYGELDAAQSTTQFRRSATDQQQLAQVAAYERQILRNVIQGRPPPPEAKLLNAPVYQSLDYYLMLARLIRTEDNTGKHMHEPLSEGIYEHARSATR